MRTTLRLALLLLFTLALTIEASAQADWHPTDGPPSDSICYIYKLSSGVLIAGGQDWGDPIWRSSNSGDSWELTSMRPAPLAVNGDTIFGIKGGNGSTKVTLELWISVDGGTNWTQIDSSAVKRISRAGQTLVVHPRYIATLTYDDYVYFFKRDGTERIADLRDAYPQALALAGDELYLLTNIGLLHSIDDGASWQVHQGGIAGGVSRNAHISVQGETVFVTDGRRVYWSKPGESEWHQAADLPAPGGRVLVDKGILYVPSAGGVFRSTDMGGNWTPVGGGLPTATTATILLRDGNTMFAGTGHGLFRAHIDTLAFTLDGSGMMRAARSLRFIGAERFAGVLHSRTDTGRWRYTGIGLGSTAGSIGASNGDTLFNVGARLYRSLDRGRSWALSDSGLHGLVSRATVRHNGAYFVSSGDSVYRSTNGGITWGSVSHGHRFLATKLVDAGNALFITSPARGSSSIQDSGVFRTNDNGANWSRLDGIAEPARYRIEHLVATSKSLLAIGMNGLYRSTDNGDTWNALTSIVIGSDVSMVARGPYAAIRTSDSLFISKDGGATWIHLQESGDRDLEAIHGDSLYTNFTALSIGNAGSPGGTVLTSPPDGYDAGSASEVDLIWNATPGATSYLVQFSSTRAFTDTLLEASTTDTSYRFTRLDLARPIYWRIVAINDIGRSASPAREIRSGISGVRIDQSNRSSLRLHIAPNPSRDRARLTIAASEQRHLRAELRSIDGRTIATLFDGKPSVGTATIEIDCAGLASGVYLVVATVGSDRAVERLIVP